MQRGRVGLSESLGIVLREVEHAERLLGAPVNGKPNVRRSAARKVTPHFPVVVLTVLLPGLRPQVENRFPVVRLREYYQDLNTPRAHDVLPAAVRNPAGELLLVRRIDDGNWELPGGRIEVAETAATTVVREVAEESGITIELTGLAGVYSDPTHVLLDPDHTVPQQLALCFHAVPAARTDADQPGLDDDETAAAAWFSTSDIADLKIHPAMLLRIDRALRESQSCTFD